VGRLVLCGYGGRDGVAIAGIVTAGPSCCPVYFPAFTERFLMRACLSGRPTFLSMASFYWRHPFFSTGIFRVAFIRDFISMFVWHLWFA
jgi:hypothetical protein